MQFSRRSFGLYCAGLAASQAVPAVALAQAERYPSRPIRVVVPVAAGGSTDVITRLVAERLGPKLGQPIVVENRPGAGGMIGAEHVAQSAPDGYTLLVGYASFALSPHLFRTQRYDPLAFVPITQLGTAPIALVAHASFAPRTLPEVVAWSKAHPATLHAGVATSGSSGHVALEQLRLAGGLDVTPVIYKSAAATLTALLAGETPIAFTTMSAALPHAKSGRLRFVATFTPRRARQLPDVPTAREGGFDVVAAGWTGLLGPPGMSAAIAQRIHAACAEVLAERDAIGRLETLGAEPVANTPAEFADEIRREFQEFKRVVEKSGMKPV